MSDAAASDEVKLTREQYQQLLKAAPSKPTVTVDAAEHNTLLAAKAELDALKPMHDRVTARMRELEMCLRREQQDHKAEMDDLIKELRKYRPPPAA